MRYRRLTGFIFAAVLSASSMAAIPARAQTNAPPSIDLPDPYAAATSFGQLPAGRAWGGTTAVAVDRDGKSVWVFERCGGESCADSNLPPILHFDPSGKLLASFGAGMFVFPHGITSRSRRQCLGGRRRRQKRQGPSGREVQPDRQGADETRSRPACPVMRPATSTGRPASPSPAMATSSLPTATVAIPMPASSSSRRPASS